MKNRDTNTKGLQLKLEAINGTLNELQKSEFNGSINCRGFKPVDKKKIIPFLLFLFACSISSFAQQAYHGGSGDGYASVTGKSVALDMNGNVQKPFIEFTVFPNPATSNHGITIQVNETNCSLQIYTVEGKIVYTHQAFISGELVPLLPAGAYFLKMENEDAFSVQKLIILPRR